MINWETIKIDLDDDLYMKPSCSCCDNTRWVIREYGTLKAKLNTAIEVVTECANELCSYKGYDTEDKYDDKLIKRVHQKLKALKQIQGDKEE